MELLLPPEDPEALTSRGAADLQEDLRRGWRVKSVLAFLRQDRIAKAFQDLRPLHHEALGQLTMVVDPVVYEFMRQEHGEDCWRDPAFRAWFRKRSPDCRVDCRSRHSRFAVKGFAASAGVRTADVIGRMENGTQRGILA